MSSERKLLGAMLTNRGVFFQLDKRVQRGDFSDQAVILMDAIRKYYEADTAASNVDRELLISFLQAEHPRHAEALATAVNDLPATSAPNVLREWVLHRRQVVGEQLAAKMMLGNHEDHELLDEYNDLMRVDPDSIDDEDEDEVYNAMSISDLLESVRPENLVPLYPESLNRAVGGGIPPEGHVVVYALPETGKSAFGITQASYAASQGRKVLYVGNEDPTRMMLLRFISRLTGWSRQQIATDPGGAEELAIRRGYGNVYFAGAEVGTMSRLDELVELIGPDLVVIDQLHGMRMRGNYSKVELLEQLTTAARAIAKRRGVAVMSITQAAGTAAGKSVLAQEDVYFSNVAVQQGCDVMIGIGMSKDEQASMSRTLSLTKNKLTGDHAIIRVAIDPSLSKIYDR